MVSLPVFHGASSIARCRFSLHTMQTANLFNMSSGYYIRKRPVYPIRTWVGKYEAHMLRLHPKKRFYYADARLEKFFSYFPDNAGLEQFTIADVTDFEKWRITQGAHPELIEMERGEIRRFWSWCIKQGCNLINPAKTQHTPAPPKNRNRLTLETFRRLLDDCPDDRIKLYLLGLFCGEELDVGLKRKAIGYRLGKLALAHDLPWCNLATLKVAVQECLWREVIRIQYKQLFETLIDKAKTASDAIANVQIPSTYERSPVSDGDLDEVLRTILPG